MYGLQVLVDVHCWATAQLEWQPQVGWHYRLTDEPGRFLFCRDAIQAARRIAANCDVTVAVVDLALHQHLHVLTPSAAIAELARSSEVAATGAPPPTLPRPPHWAHVSHARGFAPFSPGRTSPGLRHAFRRT